MLKSSVKGPDGKTFSPSLLNKMRAPSSSADDANSETAEKDYIETPPSSGGSRESMRCSADSQRTLPIQISAQLVLRHYRGVSQRVGARLNLKMRDDGRVGANTGSTASVQRLDCPTRRSCLVMPREMWNQLVE